MAKKQKKQSYLKKEKIMIGGILGAVIVALAVFIVYQIVSNNYYVKVDGESIPVGEIKMNMYNYKSYYDQMGRTDLDTPDENGMTGLQSIIQYATTDVIDYKVIYNEAIKRGITITEEQKQEAIKNTEDFKSYMGDVIMKDINLPEDQLLKLMEQQYYVLNLRKSITDTYVFDQAAFDTYFETYLVDNRQSLATYNVDYVVTENEEDAKVARTRLLDGEDYETIYKEMSVDYAEDVEVKTRSVTELYQGQDIIDAVFNLEVGEATEPVPGSVAGYVVAILREIIEPDLETAKEKAKDQYIVEQQDQLYGIEVEKWAAEAKIEVNAPNLYTLKFPADAIITPPTPENTATDPLTTDDIATDPVTTDPVTAEETPEAA